MQRAPQLIEALSARDYEGPITSVLKRNPLILSRSVRGFAFARLVTPEFRFGTDYRADFVLLGPYSGGCDIHFVELEPPGAALFTKRGCPAKRLNEALSQVGDWKRYIEKHRDTVLHELSKHVQSHELVFEYREAEPTCNGGWPLYHPEIWLHWHYTIIIGRRAALSMREQGMKSSFSHIHDVHIMTYDRLLEAAEEMDKLPNGSVQLIPMPVPKAS